jgi:acyl dehydratase
MNTPESLKARIGQEVGVSDWCVIDQDMIDRFADLTDDHQWIHVDREAAAASPFGGTIAHGFLVLSLLAKLATAADIVLAGTKMGMNYGFDKVRMTSPVRAGSRIRGRFVLRDVAERGPGQWLVTMTATVEVEGQAKPAIIAEWLGLQFVGGKP